MPLSPPAPREHIHSRDIAVRGYRRADGLWDIEAHMRDTKTYGFPNKARGTIEAGEPIHDMWLRITIDEHYVIVAAEASTEAAPFTICGDITPAFAGLKGLHLGPGWRRAVRERVGGVHGCTHLVELLGPIATVAYQTLVTATTQKPRDKDKPPRHLDSCHALDRNGPVVHEHYPEFYTGA